MEVVCCKHKADWLRESEWGFSLWEEAEAKDKLSSFKVEFNLNEAIQHLHEPTVAWCFGPRGDFRDIQTNKTIFVHVINVTDTAIGYVAPNADDIQDVYGRRMLTRFRSEEESGGRWKKRERKGARESKRGREERAHIWKQLNEHRLTCTCFCYKRTTCPCPTHFPVRINLSARHLHAPRKIWNN